MIDLFFNPNIPFWIGLGVWAAAALVFGVALWIATNWTAAKISFGGLLFVVIVSSLASLVPVLGQFLCFCIAAFLIYRMTDSDVRQAVLTVIVARGLALLVFLAAYSYVSNRQEARHQREQEALIRRIIDSQTQTNRQ